MLTTLTKDLWKRSARVALAVILALGVCGRDAQADAPRNEENVALLTDSALQRARAALERARGDACKEEEQAFQYYCIAAEQGDAVAIRRLGDCYYYGRGVELDETLACQLYSRAAELGDVDATLELVGRYYLGFDVEKNEVKAFDMSLRAAEAGRARGIGVLGMFRLQGIGIEKNEKEGIELLTLALKLGHREAGEALARCYASGSGVERDDEKAFEILSRLDLKDELLDFGELWRDGDDSCPQNPAMAFRCFERSATLGGQEAREELIKCYLEGYGVEKDETKANRWKKIAECWELGNKYFYGRDCEKNGELACAFYEEAAKLGDLGAARELADVYYCGEVVEKNKTKALEILLRAAKQGDSVACDLILTRNWSENDEDWSLEKDAWLRQELASFGDARATCELADRYFYGLGVPECKTLAFELYLKAEGLGSGKATERLVYCYGDGLGVKQDKEKAYKKACESGAPRALAYCCASGCGVERSEEKAFEICDKMKDKATWNWLGNLCRDGDLGVPQNPTFAVRCYKEAAALGDYEACFELAKRYREGDGVKKDEAKGACWERIGNELQRLEANANLSVSQIW